MPDKNGNEQEHVKLGRYLSPLGAWALSLGCAVGWGSFVMPGTTFLPKAGPLGTAAGLIIGAVIMLIIGINYSYLMNRFPDSGGTLTYTVRTFGYDHGFLSAWFLFLVYIAIIWANATALSMIARNLIGGALQFGFHYSVLGYDIYLGEVLLSLAMILVCNFICSRLKRAAIAIQTALALILIGGIAFCALSIFTLHGSEIPAITQSFSSNGTPVPAQIFSIIALSPWAYVGFESISNSTSGFRFPIKRSIFVIVAALIAAAAAYVMLALTAATAQPEGFSDWQSYIAGMNSLSGLESLPVFYSVEHYLGKAGLILLSATVAAGVITGLIGNSIAASRLMYSMAENGMLPKWFGKLNKDDSPGNAFLFLMLVSMIVPFLGRVAIGWIVDVNTIGATIAYAYTSAAALANSRKDGRRLIRVTGILGLAFSLIFFFYFMALSAGAMSTESYLILAFWSILGFVYFRYVFSRDINRHFGKSTVVWIGLLFLIFFTSLMWVRQSTNDMTKYVVDNISTHYEEQDQDDDPESIADTEAYLAGQIEEAGRLHTRNSIIQMVLVIASLAIMFSIYSTMLKRERSMELEKFAAEEGSRAKSAFLSNMSHDIRTPMNAIIGYVNLADEPGNDEQKLRECLGRIKTSSQHLLALINDVLEMSRIESGKMELELIPVDLKKTLSELRDMFSTQTQEKSIDLTVDTSSVVHNHVMCDRNRLNRVLLNLLSNAVKFTPEGGRITVSLFEIGDVFDGLGSYELRVKDSGIGMTPEFAERVFDAFERERTSTVSGIQGTGLGMAITKSIVDLMGGTIDVDTAPGRGTEFIIRISFRVITDALPEEEEDTPAAEQTEVDFTSMRLLLVEDMQINRDIATMLLKRQGFTVETAVNGKEAVEKVEASSHGYYNGVLMDIQMPVMDGYDATRAIRALPDPELASIPIIAMTANAFSEDMKKAQEADMNAHVAKPIDLNVLLTALRENLR